jgi:hypothetical protein
MIFLFKVRLPVTTTRTPSTGAGGVLLGLPSLNTSHGNTTIHNIMKILYILYCIDSLRKELRSIWSFDLFLLAATIFLNNTPQQECNFESSFRPTSRVAK